MSEEPEPAFVVSPVGHRMYVDASDDRAEVLLRTDGSFSHSTLRLWAATLRLAEWDVVVDVGANYGEMLLAADLPRDARLVCFEPSPRVLPHLRRSLDESGLDVDLRELAVGAEDTEAAFAMDLEWSGRSGLVGTHRSDAEHTLREVTVPVRTLDSELDLDTSDRVCVKVDVEGAEFDVLTGAHALTSRRRPWAIMMEVLHMDGFERARLARDFTMQVMDRRTGGLVTVPPASPQRVDDLLRSSWIHDQDVVLTAREAA